MAHNQSVRIGERYIIAEAERRARAALKEKNASYSVGFCDGIIHNDFGVFTSVWCVIFDSIGTRFVSGGMHMPLSGPLLGKLNARTLTEEDIETFLQIYFPSSYQSLIEYALLNVSGPD